MTTERPPSGRPAAARRRRRSRFAERNLLTNPVPVIAASVAAFAVALSGLTGRPVGGSNPGAAAAVVGRPATGTGGPQLSTRASGAPNGATATLNVGSAPAPVVTSTSGAATGYTGGERDDA